MFSPPLSVRAVVVRNSAMLCCRLTVAWHCRHGFTLPEALAGIGILSALLAVSAPILSRVTDSFALRGATQNISAELQRARLAAVTENRRQRWGLVNDHTYEVSRYDAGTDEWQASRTIDVHRDSRAVTIVAEAPIIFAPNGSAPSAGTVTLTASTATLRIVVSPSGSIAIDR